MSLKSRGESMKKCQYHHLWVPIVIVPRHSLPKYFYIILGVKDYNSFWGSLFIWIENHLKCIIYIKSKKNFSRKKIASYQIWGWKGISSQNLFRCMIPIATKKTALRLPRRDSITLQCPDTMPERHKVKQSTWMVWKRTLHLQTCFHIKFTSIHACWNRAEEKSCDSVLQHPQSESSESTVASWDENPDWSPLSSSRLSVRTMRFT